MSVPLHVVGGVLPLNALPVPHFTPVLLCPADITAPSVLLKPDLQRGGLCLHSSPS